MLGVTKYLTQSFEHLELLNLTFLWDHKFEWSSLSFLLKSLTFPRQVSEQSKDCPIVSFDDRKSWFDVVTKSMEPVSQKALITSTEDQFHRLKVRNTLDDWLNLFAIGQSFRGIQVSRRLNLALRIHNLRRDFRLFEFLKTLVDLTPLILAVGNVQFVHSNFSAIFTFVMISFHG